MVGAFGDTIGNVKGREGTAGIEAVVGENASAAETDDELRL